MMKMQPRFSFSVDSLLGRKTNEADIKSECLGGFTQITDTKSDHRPSGSFVTKYFIEIGLNFCQIELINNKINWIS